MNPGRYDRLTRIIVSYHMRKLRNTSQLDVEEHLSATEAAWIVPNRARLNIQQRRGQPGVAYDIAHTGEMAEPAFHPQVYIQDHDDEEIRIGRAISRQLFVDIFYTLSDDTIQHLATHEWFNRRPTYPIAETPISRKEMATAFARPEIDIEQIERFRL